MMFDNGSKDGTEWWIGTDRFKKNLSEMGLDTLRLLPPIPVKGIFQDAKKRKNKGLEHQLAKAAWECSADPPDAILWLQADVVMPDDALKKMVKALEDDERLGCIGVIHRDEVDHVRMGCALYRWEPFAELAEIGFFTDGCPCRWMHRTMEKSGWTSRNLEGVRGKHLSEGEDNA